MIVRRRPHNTSPPPSNPVQPPSTMSPTAAFGEQRQPRAAARLDRLPPTRWLGGIMALLFLSWLVESYDIGLTGSVLPSLTQQFALSTSMKSFVAIAANIGIVVGIVPAGHPTSS
jgi:putative MFS transporter